MNGNGNKIVLMAIAVVAIGIFALPTTISMFGGQHNWYDLNETGNQVPCIKCHGDIYDEYMMTGVHGTLSSGANSYTPGDNPDAACDACHRVAPEAVEGITFASGDGTASIAGKEAHAASTVACMACHEFDAFNVTYPPAGGFANMSAAPYNTNTIFNYTDATHNGSRAAHNAYIAGAIGDPLMDDSNEACIACHTHVAIDINWTKEYKMYLEVYTDHLGNWTCENFKSEGTYNVTTYGNMSGETTGVSEPVIEISPTPPGYDQSNP